MIKKWRRFIGQMKGASNWIKINGVRRRRSKPMDLEKWAKMKKRKRMESENGWNSRRAA
jgi:hypothetical protein